MNKYELLYIVGTHYTDAEVAEIQAKVAGMLEKVGAKILRNEMVGKIRLAYIIKKARHGSYILVHFDAEPSVIGPFNRQMELTEEILRHTLLLRAPGAETKKFEIFAYVPPLSDEGKRIESKPALVREKSVRSESAEEVLPVDRAEANMSIEELDKKLDEILEDDLSEKV
jgi:small subunit ribosomal protein S6